MRGSTFGDIPGAAGVMTAMWVYLDGNGGGSRTQQVRGAMYGNAGNSHLDALKELETETVTTRPASLLVGCGCR